MPTASHLRNLRQALDTCRKALEEFESALQEFEEVPEEREIGGEEPKRSEPKWPEPKVAFSPRGLPGAGDGQILGLQEDTERGDTLR